MKSFEEWLEQPLCESVDSHDTVGIYRACWKAAYAAGLDQSEHILNVQIASLRLIYRGIDASYLESARDEIRRLK